MTGKMDLNPLFQPGSIAVIGASRDPHSVGQGVLRNLSHGCVLNCKFCKPFKGKIYPVNPKAAEILGMKCYPSVLDIPGPVDLAVISVPAPLVIQVIKECIKKKVKGLIVITAGFGELGEKGKAMQDELALLARNANIPLVGPNCLGIIRPSWCMNASFSPCTPPGGKIAFVSQSGALADSIIDWAVEARYGFSALVSYGNKAVLDSHDYIEWLSHDRETKAITLYIEGLKDGRAFMQVAKRVNMVKPIIALKAGRTAQGMSAVSSHTGSLAGSYETYMAAFRQCGIEIADTVEELFDLAKALAHQPPCRGNGIAIVTNGGGCGVLCADYCELYGVNLTILSEKLLKGLDKSGKMHPAYSRRNPLDLVGDALPERYELAINSLLAEKDVHGMIVIQTLQTMTEPEEDARIVIEAHKRFPDKPIICVYMGGKYSKKGIRLLEAHGIPDFNDLKKAAGAMAALVRRGEFLKKV